ncbi:hypothetical protein GCM10009760_25980 [Kitasatospora kazusensis]|uniref:Siphovirus-type tail component C-terminal domain-containing protein n=1 Tax=Kitasatospora kazusensis TaxID=407974 RepID=A0ABN2ZFW6_9ACTN
MILLGSPAGLRDFQLSVNGVTLGPGTPYLVHAVEGLGLPEVRHTDAQRAGTDGNWYGVDAIDGRTLTLSVTVVGADPASARAAYDTLMGAWWLPPGVPYLTLNLKLPGREENIIGGRPRRAEADTTRLLGRRVGVTLTLVAADPRIYSSTTYGVPASLPVAPGGRVYPRVYPLTFGGTGTSGAVLATNTGNTAVWPLITVTGPCTSPVITNSATGAWIGAALTLGPTDVLTIDTDQRTITLNGTASRRSTLIPGSTWWPMLPGVTQLTYTAQGYAAASQSALAWRNAWIG